MASLTLDVDGEQFTIAPADGERLGVRRGACDDALTVALDRDAFSDLIQDVATTFGLQLSGRAEIRQGPVDDFVAWEPVLRCLFDGRPVYEPGSITLRDRDGAAARPAPVVHAR